jgi:hypothetical protein
VAQIRRGLDLAGPALASATVDGLTLWYDPEIPGGPDDATTAHLLSCFDEYVVAYSDTKFAANLAGLVPAGDRSGVNTLVNAVLLDGQIAGFWRRRPDGKSVALDVDLATDLTAKQRKALDAELSRHTAFAGVPVRVTYV